jgi:hypothetical protein
MVCRPPPPSVYSAVERDLNYPPVTSHVIGLTVILRRQRGLMGSGISVRGEMSICVPDERQSSNGELEEDTFGV